ncbi:MAG TPA: hypothetical protein VE990_16895 [Acidimicrobiales bacterium]|nr:hypothetical protein [Acidimicrobiales bacterium]
MPSPIDRMTTVLYRVGFHHPSGQSSIVALTASPARLVLGELAALAADRVTGGRGAGEEEPQRR